MSEFEGLQAAEEAKPKNPFELIGDSGDLEYDDPTPTEVATPEEGTPVAEVEEESEVEVEEAPVVKAQYTLEEVTELIRNDGDIDTSRLSPEGQAVMKAMQRGFTPKLEEAAAIRKELEEVKQAIESAKPKEQPKDIYEAYDQDPKGVLEYVDGEIGRLIQEGAADNAIQIEQLRNLKDQFRDRELQKLRSQSTQASQVHQAMQEIRKQVPDIAQKEQALAKFAIEVMGYTPEELAQVTNPAIGMSAVQAIARINRTYDRFNAGRTVQTKKEKPKPTQVETPGRGFEPKQTNPLEDLKKNAIKTGNFRDYFLALEEE